jgi:hypothetical protein
VFMSDTRIFVSSMSRVHVSGDLVAEVVLSRVNLVRPIEFGSDLAKF